MASSELAWREQECLLRFENCLSNRAGRFSKRPMASRYCLQVNE